MVFFSIAQASITIIAWYILKKFFTIKNNKICMLFSCICSYAVVTRATVIFNETPLIVMSWLLAVVLLNLVYYKENKSKKRFWTLFLFILMGYVLTLHTRMVIVWFCLAVFLVCHFWAYKKLLISLKMAIFSGGIAFIAGQFLVKLFQKLVWLNEYAGVELRNASIELPNASKWLNVGTLHGVADIIIGNINTISVFTGGFIIICVVYILDFFIRGIFKEKTKKMGGVEEYQYTLFLFFGLCAAAMIAGLAISWGNGAGIGINQGFSGTAYAFKAFTYVRYFGPFIGPVILAGLVKLYLSQKDDMILKISSGIFVLFQILWVCCVLPYIVTDSNSREVYMAFSLWNNNKELGFVSFILGTVVASITFSIFIGMIKKKKWCLFGVLFLGLLIYQYSYDAIYYDLQLCNNNSVRVDDSYDFVHELEKYCEVPGKIYVEDATARTDHQTFYIYQFWLNRYEIIPEKPKENESYIFFTNNIEQNVDLLHQKDCKMINLDYENKEFVLIKGESLCNAAKMAGYTLEDTLSYSEEFDFEKMLYNQSLVGEKEKDYVESNGYEGYIIYGPYEQLNGGSYELDIRLKLIAYEQEDLGYIEVVYDNRDSSVCKRKINCSDFDSDGQLDLKVEFSCNALQNVEYRIYVNQGTIIGVKPINRAYVSDRKDLLQDDYVNACRLQEIVQDLGSGKQIIYVLEDAEIQEEILFDSLYELLPEFHFFTMQEDELLNSPYKSGQFILISSDNEHLDQYCKDFVIIQKLKDYALLVRKDDNIMNKLEQLEIFPLSTEDGIKSEFYSISNDMQICKDMSMQISKGTYSIKYLTQVENVKDYVGNQIGEIIVYKDNKILSQTAITKKMLGEDGKLLIEKPIYLSGEEVRIVVRMSVNCKMSNQELFVKKVSENRLIDLSLLCVQEGYFDKTQINSSGIEGCLEYGPYETLEEGSYIIRITYDVSESKENMLGYADVVTNGEEIGKEELYLENSEENILVVEIPVEAEDRYSNVEYRTYVYQGSKIKLVSIEILEE